MAKQVKAEPGVLDVFTYIGQQAPKFYYNETSGNRADNLAHLVVRTEGRSTTVKLVSKLLQELPGKFPGTRINVRELEQGLPVGAPVAIRIQGEDISKLRELADQVTGILTETPGTLNVFDDMGLDTYTLKVNSSSDYASHWGVSGKDLASSVRLAVEGLHVSDYRFNDKILPIVLRTQESNESSIEDIASLQIPSLKTGTLLPITQIASLEPGWTSAIINRKDLQRVITVRAFTDGTLAEDIVQATSKKIKAIPLPPGYKIEYGGENEYRNDVFLDLGRISIIVVMLIYIMLSIQFHSFITPIIVMLSVFLALSGAVLGLFITGTPIGFMAILGIVSLSGIVVRNGIVLIDFIEIGLRERKSLSDSIVEAGGVRLRPILLTATTAICSLMPMAILGGSLWRPMAVSIISGLIYSTVLTLVIVPNVYLLLSNIINPNNESSNQNNVTHTQFF